MTDRLEGAHTAGPWHVEYGPAGGYIISDNANGFTLCSRSFWPHREAQSHGNARLIAAAPEMLMALERIEKITCTGDRTSDEMIRVIARAFFTAKAAISKAERRSHD